jgi:hypothetical protein
MGKGLSAPLFNLLLALDDLNKGIIAPILALSLEERKLNRPGHNTSRKLNQGLAVFCSDLLLEDGLSLEEACRFVAQELKKAGLKVHGKRDAQPLRTVKSWRDEVSQLPEDHQIRHIVKTLRASLNPERSKGSAKQDVREIVRDVAVNIGRFGQLD